MTNAGARQLDRCLEIAGALLTLPFLIQTLGTDNYGLWAIVWSIIGLYALIDFGFSGAVVKFLAQTHSSPSNAGQSHCLSTLFWVFVTQMGILLGITLLCLPTLGHWLHPVSTLHAEFRKAMTIVGCGYALQIPLSVFRGVLIAEQRGWIAHLGRGISQALYILAVFLILPFYPQLSTLAWISWITALGPGLVALTWVYFQPRTPLRLQPSLFKWKELRRLGGFSVHLALIQVCLFVATRADTLIIQAFLSLEAVALYAVAARIADQLRSFCIQITHTTTPVIAELDGARDDQSLKKLWLKSTHYTLAFSLPLLGGAFFFAQEILIAWVGQSFAPAAPALQFLLAAVFCSLLFSASQNQLSMRGEESFLSKAMGCGQLANIALSIMVAREWGIVGVAAVTLIVPAFTDILLVQPRVSRLYSISLGRFLREVLEPLLAPVSAGIAVLFLLEYLLKPSTLSEIAFSELVLLTIYGWTYLLRNPQEKRWLRDALRRKDQRSSAFYPQGLARKTASMVKEETKIQ
ncbi:MAG: oligosaccharide flippase family protein [Polyangiaceae bacterium]|nr:oligosaccharide flippase family protein [Polyangiaceae bacterium]